MMKKVQRVQAERRESRYGKAWRIISEITGQKRTMEGQVEGHSPKERVTKWFNHF